MNELALIKIQSKILGLDRELKQYVDELLSGQGLLNEDQLSKIINSITRELSIYNYILKQIIKDGNNN
jgi:outer membrane protein assembly factor BamA